MWFISPPNQGSKGPASLPSAACCSSLTKVKSWRLWSGCVQYKFSNDINHVSSTEWSFFGLSFNHTMGMQNEPRILDVSQGLETPKYKSEWYHYGLECNVIWFWYGYHLRRLKSSILVKGVQPDDYKPDFGSIPRGFPYISTQTNFSESKALGCFIRSTGWGIISADYRLLWPIHQGLLIGVEIADNGWMSTGGQDKTIFHGCGDWKLHSCSGM